jgi:hypothetical protein
MNDLIKDSIKNETYFNNTPDQIYFGGECYTFNKMGYNGHAVGQNYTCYPFTYEALITKQVYFGKPFTTHYNIEPKILTNIFTKYTPKELDLLYPNLNVCDYIIDIYQAYEYAGLKWNNELLSSHLILDDLDLHYNEEIDSDLFNEIFPVDEITFRGRLYEINIEEELYLIVTMWNLGHKDVQGEYLEVINKVLSKIDTSKFSGIFVARGQRPYLVYSSDVERIDIDNNEKAHNIHLANQEDKRKFFEPFIKTRDEKNDEKLAIKDKDGNVKRYMTQAEYNFLKNKYLGENKRRRIRLTESQVREIIKNEIKK